MVGNATNVWVVTRKGKIVGVPADYKKQDGCWNCERVFAAYGGHYCNRDKDAESSGNAYNTWRNWCITYCVEPYGKCGRHKKG